MTLHLKTQADAERTLLVGDLHLGDPKAAKKRGFKHIEEHDDMVLATLRESMTDATELIVVGDLAPAGSLESALTWIAGLPGRKHLILGNIDPGHPCQPNGHEELWKYNSVFSSVQLHLGVLYDGVAAVISHFPFEGDTGSRADRFEQWRLRDVGTPVFHGHTHKTTRRSNSCWGTPQLHVGFEAWHRPVAAIELFQMLASRAKSLETDYIRKADS